MLVSKVTNSNMNKNFLLDNENAKVVNKTVVSRSLMKRLISLSGLGLVKGGAISGAENRRALRNNDKEISLDNQRPQRNACKESHNSNMNRNFLLDNENAKVVNKKVVSRSLMKRLISLSGLGLVKGGAVSGAENRRALRNNDKEISLDNQRPQMNACKESHNSNMNKNILLDNENAKVVNKKVVSRSLMKRLISLSGLGLVKGGAVSGAENRRALRNNDKEISLDNKRPQRNACKESHNSNMNRNFLLDNENAKVVNKKSCE